MSDLVDILGVEEEKGAKFTKRCIVKQYLPDNTA
jgi:hypothetical protein